ncbi:MAG TPA: ubiquinol-cytochrome c reductase iron-sulfur subunit [Nitrospinaceae bacterium]|jgi:cytochrome b6-f complex iron-sulfur subunit|nr:ubiquinol-cytochrome c reductase iron-sulfur subunit [Nitrospinaceae bacterium]HJL72783.1 ubiquinol-cytochrome c reductase iron-sulfur subunit [Nitrospinaceae bacterium]HJN99409.1 ubiquinol-cytochrome c reductase iron-sulfur subunit [Nitrospinaceae bacterium]|tara:strand:+ start:5042 stop:5611 length:570 start_codon:yes stop_codon:yes gene_type:complete
MAEAEAGLKEKPAKSTGKKSGKKKEENTDTLWSRRDFFSLAGWASFMASLGLSGLYFTRLLFPRVLFEPSPIFKAGKPSDYTVGDVSTKWVKEQRVWIVRDLEGIYVIFALCTHLGCTPRWLKTESKYKCPCHGSGFTKQGVNFEGPAPRALERLKIEVGPDGQIIIDKSKKYLMEKDEWTKPGAKLFV